MKIIEKDYVNEIEASSLIFEFAKTLVSFQKLEESLVRVNAIIPGTSKILLQNTFFLKMPINAMEKSQIILVK